MTNPSDPAAAACTLEPEARRERTALLREEILPHAEGSDTLTDGPGRAWTFARTPELEARLEHLVALESECCRGPVTFHLEQDAARDALRLVVRGLDPLAPGSGMQDATRRGLGRVAKAGGTGVAIALGVACALPWVAAAAFGAAAAAPLTGLDHPLPIALLAIAASVLVWRRWGRPATPREASPR